MTSPAFAAQYAVRCSSGRSAAPEAMFTMVPRPACFMAGSAAWHTSMGPVRSTAMIAAHSAEVIRSKGRMRSIPALLTTPSSPPSVVAACATAART